jgi:hypothetical protein
MRVKSGNFVSVLILVMVFCSVSSACEGSKADVDPGQLAIQADREKFNRKVDELKVVLTSIQDPCNLDVNKIFPDDWMAEPYRAKDGKNMVAIAVPIPKDTGRGMAPYKGYIMRAGLLNPNTNTYLSSSWDGSKYNWGNQDRSIEERRYPQQLNADYFKEYKIMFQPYMVPSEASHGIYEYKFDVKNCSMEGASKLAGDLKLSNPYNAIIAGTYTDNTSYLASIKEAENALLEVQDDCSAYSTFLALLDRNFFLQPAYSDSKKAEMTQYYEEMAGVKAKLEAAGKILGTLKTWDFSGATKSQVK